MGALRNDDQRRRCQVRHRAQPFLCCPTSCWHVRKLWCRIESACRTVYAVLATSASIWTC